MQDCGVVASLWQTNLDGRWLKREQGVAMSAVVEAQLCPDKELPTIAWTRVCCNVQFVLAVQLDRSMAASCLLVVGAAATRLLSSSLTALKWLCTCVVLRDTCPGGFLVVCVAGMR